MPSFDALLPPEMAQRAEDIGIRKATLPTDKMLLLAILAGAYIALGALFSIVALSGTSSLPYGVSRVLGGLVFCLGLILVVVGGAELFTGNNLIVMAWASRKVGTRALLRNWLIVYVGNFIGAVGTALLLILAQHYTFADGRVGETALKIALSKLQFGFWQAVVLGILCNGLVCLAVWLTYSARSTTDKIMAILFPITAFVAAGFEHSIANMFFIPYALFIKHFHPDFLLLVSTVGDISALSWINFLLKNLVPVTLGNIIGGVGLVALLYWSIYLRASQKL
ncbi:MAG: formate transporter FocA [Anaerolineales bacterium]|nr:formate transporter FocA [Anaerolineales bacterium]MDW8227895.1 formate transporter FocA [Anaerolineales bacterium]